MYDICVCTLEESDEDVGRRADVLRRAPGQQEGLCAHQSGGTGLCRVQQDRRQPVELRQVDEGEPEQSPVSGGQVVRYGALVGRLQRILRTKKQTGGFIFNRWII